MILGVGLDVVDVAAFAQQLADPASGFVAATFRPGERRRFPPARPGADPAAQHRRALHLAGRFAAKEAFLKAWSSARRGRRPAMHAADLDLRDIEVVDDGFGRPSLRLHGAVHTEIARLTEPGPPALHLSISHDGGVAVAVVVLEASAPSQEC
jgi:holo-[acyl-carrier protein] synthase